jgi:hypothetical protein
MNERIRELAEQALKSSMVHDGSMYRPEGYANGVSKDFADKFAELIVRECLAQVARVDDMLEDNPAQTAAVAWVASSIADHFGVES